MRERLLGICSAGVLLLTTACDGSEEGAAPAERPSRPSATQTSAGATGATQDHNRSDLEFAREMVAHHAQAEVVAELALERASDPEVKDLAERIKAAQSPEKKQIMDLLLMWGEDVEVTGSGGGHDHSHLMSEEAFQQLHQARSAEFDELWLRSMIEHHENAVELAEAQLRDGSDSLAKLFAQTIVDRQRAEVTEMTALLQR
ncbi:DUF305 domain-containing protein [Prauserella endophytica]|uniref:DUF305 domain-containing protein n=1 Tax=Prauserella endophytica TaxID=1592324 RepID=A0ABY2S222_9PSEU|nr:DUF305 domain-containing protein [Prauserella endophytica]TKG69260.1 DUF305 domain-containing protein [Prauserella endophytica]